MTPHDAETRLRIARLALWSVTKRHTAAVLVGRPANRTQAVAKFEAADALRRAEAEYEAAKHAAEGMTPHDNGRDTRAADAHQHQEAGERGIAAGLHPGVLRRRPADA